MSDVFFSDIMRSEALAICEALLAAGKADLIPDMLRQGACLADVRRLLAAETPSAAGTLLQRGANSARKAGIDRDLEEAAAARFRG